MKRTIKKQVWLNRTEARELQKKAKKACLSEAGLVRMLISGYEPRQQPDESFYELARQLSAVGNSLNQIAAKAHSLGYIDEVILPEQTRAKLIAALEMAQNKNVSNPPKKHGNMPL